MTDTLQVSRLHVAVDAPCEAFLAVGREEWAGLRIGYVSLLAVGGCAVRKVCV